MINSTELLCSIDDFWKNFEPLWKEKMIAEGKKESKRQASLILSEVMTIITLFHIHGYRNFKTFYTGHALKYLIKEFPGLPSYNRFVELKKSVVLPLHCYLMSIRGGCTGISFVDSTSLEVCHYRRARSHKVFKDIAKKGKTSTGWFYGMKLHVVVNDQGELLGMMITKLRKNMKNKLMPLMDKLLLRKRGIIETIFDQLKNISQIEHSRHRSPINFLVNLFAGLVAYSLQPKKPALNVCRKAFKLLDVS